MSAKSRDSADSLDSEIVFDLSDEVKLRWIQFISVKLTVASANKKVEAGSRALFVCWGSVIMIADLFLQDHPPP